MMYTFGQYQVSTEPVFTKPETTTVDRWFEPLSQPYFRKSSIPCQQDNFAWSGYTPSPPVYTSIDRWLQQLSLPVWPRVGTVVDLQPSFVEPVWPHQETVSEDRWHQPFSLPVWPRPGLSAAAQEAFAWSNSTPGVMKSTSEDRWHQPFTQPYPMPKGLGVAAQSSYIAPVSEQKESVSIDRWLQPLSVPPPPRAALAAADQRDFTTAVWPYPQSVGIDKWLQPLSVPPGAARGIGAWLTVTAGFTALYSITVTTPITTAIWRWNGRYFVNYGPRSVGSGSGVIVGDVQGCVAEVVTCPIKAGS